MKLTSGMFLIVHVPKTAGTSLRLALERYFGSASVVRDYGPNANATSKIVREHIYAEKEENRDALIRAASESGAKVLVGHFPAEKYADYFDPDQIVAFVRDPLERACSEYLHRTKNKTFSGTFEKFVQSVAKINIQSRFLKGIPDQSFVGLTEQYPKSLRYLNELYGLKLRHLKRNINKAGGGADLLNRLSDSQKTMFYEYNQDDVDLYEQYKSRFSSLDIPPAKLKSMARFFKSANFRRRHNKET